MQFGEIKSAVCLCHRSQAQQLSPSKFQEPRFRGMPRFWVLSSFKIATKTGLYLETVKQKLSAVLPPVVDQVTSREYQQA
jgi:hypothetical protein